VKLCCRRNPSLLKILSEEAEKLKEGRLEQQKMAKERGTGKDRGRREDLDSDVEEETVKGRHTRSKKRMIDSD